MSQEHKPASVSLTLRTSQVSWKENTTAVLVINSLCQCGQCGGSRSTFASVPVERLTALVEAIGSAVFLELGPPVNVERSADYYFA